MYDTFQIAGFFYEYLIKTVYITKNLGGKK